jgi:hypothetical protein
VLSVTILTLFIALNTPMFVWHIAGHDDGMFMTNARSILDSGWFGGYNQYILAKGPTYSIFVALSSLSGLPINLVHAVFQLLAIWTISRVVFRLTNSTKIATTMFAVMALSPVTLMPEVRRVVRDQIYWPLTLLVFAAFVAVLFVPMKRNSRVLLALAAGVLLALTWLTREEGIWLLPGLAMLMIGSILINWKNQREKLVTGFVLTLATGAFFVIHGLLFSINYFVYGSFSGVDFKDKNYARVLNGLQSVNSGPIRPFVPVTLETRRAVAAAVPSFKPLQEALEPRQPVFGWEKPGCAAYPSTCGDIAGGWFVWALRDAAAQNKFYTSPSEATKKYGEIADGIDAACADGRLKCRRPFISYLPSISDQQWLEFPVFIWRAAKLMAFVNVSDVSETPIMTSTQINHPLFIDRWELLNRPLIFKSADEVEISGWYYDPEHSEWPEFSVQSLEGQKVVAQFSRAIRPDLVTAFNDLAAFQNGFSATFICPSKCTITATTKSSTITEQLVVGSHKGTTKASFYLDQVTGENKIIPPSTQFSLFILADVLVPAYKVITPLFVIFGLCAFMVRVAKAYWFRRLTPILVVILAAYTMIGCRILLLALIETSSFPAVILLYSMPGMYVLMFASILSFVVLWERKMKGLAE